MQEIYLGEHTGVAYLVHIRVSQLTQISQIIWVTACPGIYFSKKSNEKPVSGVIWGFSQETAGPHCASQVSFLCFECHNLCCIGLAMEISPMDQITETICTEVELFLSCTLEMVIWHETTTAPAPAPAASQPSWWDVAPVGTAYELSCIYSFTHNTLRTCFLCWQWEK